jgi:hypothetical protein
VVFLQQGIGMAPQSHGVSIRDPDMGAASQIKATLDFSAYETLAVDYGCKEVVARTPEQRQNVGPQNQLGELRVLRPTKRNTWAQRSTCLRLTS